MPHVDRGKLAGDLGHGPRYIALGMAGRKEQHRDDDDLPHAARSQRLKTFADRGTHEFQKTRLDRRRVYQLGHACGDGQKLVVAHLLARAVAHEQQPAVVGKLQKWPIHRATRGRASVRVCSPGNIVQRPRCESTTASGILKEVCAIWFGRVDSCHPPPLHFGGAVYVYLTMIVGREAGLSFLLDPTEENRIGRDPECTITLDDPLCSRVHAIVTQEQGSWRIRDCESRNGTYVNEQKIDDAVLADGNAVRIGSSEFEFHRTEQPPTIASQGGGELTETVIKNFPMQDGHFEPQPLAALADTRRAQELLLLYQFSIKLLGCDSPDEVVRTSLDLVHDWTHATVVGYLSLTDQGDLKPRIVIPLDARPTPSSAEG